MNNKFKTFGIVMYISMLALLTSGCTQLFESETSKLEQMKGPAKITQTPVDVFKGEGAKFQPFLGAMSGAFKLRYEGNKPNAKLDIDIWKNGKKVASAGSIGDLFFSSDVSESHEVEVIISIATVSIEGQDEFNTIKVGTIHDSGSTLATFTIPWEKKLTTRGLIYNNEPRTFMADESVYLWGMQATSTNVIHTADLSPESLSRLESALIFTLRIEE
ncbi:hypothetical protein [Paenibacillus sp. Soil522]|uniref:hypothetical protein n=1 Tax=Paenibacillus sp. Soil522 TaxID=1736388 RepID=UPI0006FFDD0B|nr:hypothetical protein [Paenibacillus sp. Soil522]KRE29757.1 hypothetical protein ASG81_26015 [Paenibacillus sp. Soil522]